MSLKSGSCASELAPSQLGRKLLDLTFAEFLKLLRERGRGDKADRLEKQVVRRLVPPLSKSQVLGMTIEAVGLAAEIVSLIKAMRYEQSNTIAGRIAELKAEGFTVVSGERHG